MSFIESLGRHVVAVVVALPLIATYQPAWAGFCTPPSAPSCPATGRFYSDSEIRSCESDMRSYESSVRAYTDCLKDESDTAVREYERAVERFNCYAKGSTMC